MPEKLLNLKINTLLAINELELKADMQMAAAMAISYAFNLIEEVINNNEKWMDYYAKVTAEQRQVLPNNTQANGGKKEMG